MVNNCKIILIAVACILLHSIDAAEFTCSDEPTVCKTNFEAQFERNFKELYTNAVRKLLTTYVDKANTIKAQLPADDPYVKPIEESLNGIGTSIQTLKDNANDDKKIMEAIDNGVKIMESTVNIEPKSKRVEELIESENVEKDFKDINRQLASDVVNVWFEMYSGLTEEVKKISPKDVEINEFMETLRRKGDPKLSDVADVLGIKMDSVYSKIFDDEI